LGIGCYRGCSPTSGKRMFPEMFPSPPARSDRSPPRQSAKRRESKGQEGWGSWGEGVTGHIPPPAGRGCSRGCSPLHQLRLTDRHLAKGPKGETRRAKRGAWGSWGEDVPGDIPPLAGRGCSRGCSPPHQLGLTYRHD